MQLQIRNQVWVENSVVEEEVGLQVWFSSFQILNLEKKIISVFYKIQYFGRICPGPSRPNPWPAIDLSLVTKYSSFNSEPAFRMRCLSLGCPMFWKMVRGAQVRCKTLLSTEQVSLPILVCNCWQLESRGQSGSSPRAVGSGHKGRWAETRGPLGLGQRAVGPRPKGRCALGPARALLCLETKNASGCTATM